MFTSPAIPRAGDLIFKINMPRVYGILPRRGSYHHNDSVHCNSITHTIIIVNSRPKHTELTDGQLIAAYRAGGDNQWLGYLLRRYTALLLGVALKYLKDKSLAEDAVQQVFIKVLTSLPAGEILNFKGWLYILMRNHCLQQLRDRPLYADESAIALMPATEADKEDIAWHEHTLQQMDDALTMLSSEQRTAITLFYLKKFSYEQIIAHTGHTFMQVKSHIQNGKRNLKMILLKKIGTNRP